MESWGGGKGGGKRDSESSDKREGEETSGGDAETRGERPGWGARGGLREAEGSSRGRRVGGRGSWSFARRGPVGWKVSQLRSDLGLWVSWRLLFVFFFGFSRRWGLFVLSREGGTGHMRGRVPSPFPFRTRPRDDDLGDLSSGLARPCACALSTSRSCPRAMFQWRKLPLTLAFLREALRALLRRSWSSRV